MIPGHELKAYRHTSQPELTSVVRRFESNDAAGTAAADSGVASSAAELNEISGDSALRPAEFSAAAARQLRALDQGGLVCVMQVDIDHFEALNSVHGATVGAEVLARAAGRIREAVRPYDLVARVDGNGYAVVWHQDSSDTPPMAVGARIARRFDTPIQTSIGELAITVSIGVVSTNGGDDDTPPEAQTLLAQARAAVVAAQRQGRAQLAEFDPDMLHQAVQTYETERHLRLALRDRSVSVDFQPIVNLNNGEVVAVEALARWRGKNGPISPALFIPVAEESGLINALGKLVIEASIHQGAKWRALGHRTLVSVNLSNNQLLDSALIPTIRSIVDTHGLDPRYLCLEITESVVMDDVAKSMTILGQLKDLGMVLAIDDFGTGYSSLSYLRRLPVDIIKIDRSFVQTVHNRDDRVIAKAIIDLAHTLGMTTIAEGVETPLQVEVLHTLNCDMAQGFLLHSPAPAPAVDFTPTDFDALWERPDPTLDLTRRAL